MNALTALVGNSGKAIDFLGNSELLRTIARLVEKREEIAVKLAALQSPKTVDKWLEIAFDLIASDEVTQVLDAVGLGAERQKIADRRTIGNRGRRAAGAGP